MERTLPRTASWTLPQSRPLARFVPRQNRSLPLLLLIFLLAGSLAHPGPTPLDTGPGYKAFPGLTVLPDGSYLLVYRHGADHVGTLDGTVVTRTSRDGVAWSDPQLIAAQVGVDLRFGSAATALSDGRILVPFDAWDGRRHREYLAFGSGGSWTQRTVVYGFTDWAILSGPILESGDRWLLPLYGRNIGDAFDSAAMLISDDQGGSWRQFTISDGQVAQSDRQEPWTRELADRSLLTLMRSDTDNTIRASWSPDGMAWSEPVAVFYGAGRPAFTVIGTTLLATYRAAGEFPASVYRVSRDDGHTWSDEGMLDVSDGYSEYAAAVARPDGSALVVLARERSRTDADLFTTTIPAALLAN